LSDYKIFETAEFLDQLAKLPPDDAGYVRNRLNERVYPQLRRAGDSSSSARRDDTRTTAPDSASNGRFRLFYRIDHEDRIVYLLTFKRRAIDEPDELDEEMIEALPDAAAPPSQPESQPKPFDLCPPQDETDGSPEFRLPEEWPPATP
jgi:mRNA interferase RelE/StbE